MSRINKLNGKVQNLVVDMILFKAKTREHLDYNYHRKGVDIPANQEEKSEREKLIVESLEKDFSNRKDRFKAFEKQWRSLLREQTVIDEKMNKENYKTSDRTDKFFEKLDSVKLGNSYLAIQYASIYRLLVRKGEEFGFSTKIEGFSAPSAISKLIPTRPHIIFEKPPAPKSPSAKTR